MPKENRLSLEVLIQDIPQSVFDEVGLRLQDYLVPLYVLGWQNAEPQLRFIGSGTLVEIQGTYHILTAAHVWHEARNAEQIGMVLTAYPSRFLVPRAAISAKQLWKRPLYEWGPDLALLELARPFVSTIAAYKSFLNLVLHRAMFASHPPATEKGLWAVTGLVGQFSEVQRLPDTKIIDATAQARAFFSLVQQTHWREGHEYVDLGVKVELSGVPSSFGGVSGGGLWEVGLSMAKSGALSWDGRRYLRGVAFWQLERADGRCIIRCHGPRSIFETAWESWELPRSG